MLRSLPDLTRSAGPADSGRASGIAFALTGYAVKAGFTKIISRAYVKKNIVTEGLSGMLGNSIVFRQRGGKTIVAVRPKTSEQEPTEGQKQQQNKFREANRYATQATQDPTLKAAYEQRTKGNQSAFNVAMADYLNSPDITELDLGSYTGSRGHQLRIKVTDDYLVTDVQVALYGPTGNLLEQGTAALHDNGLDWVYTTQKANAKPSGSKLVVYASDLPGNTTEKEAVSDEHT